MTAHMQDTSILAYPFHRLHSLLFEHIYLLVQSQGTLGMKDFMKDPGRPNVALPIITASTP